MSVIPDYNSPQAIRFFLEEHGMAMQKKFGQNFLINASARQKLIHALEVGKNTSVWEIGPGLGCMTAEILERGAAVTAFEIDRGFCTALRGFFGGRADFSLIEGDVLKTWKTRLAETGAPDRLFGNLPYNIAAVILGDTISALCRFDLAVVTVQKEVALRMAASPDSENYSSFSVLCQWAYDVSTVLDLGSSLFWPAPRVDSRAVKLIKKADFPRCKDPALFMKLLRAAFSSRRKTLKNNLAQLLGGAPQAQSVLEQAAINPQLRAECLSVELFLRLSDAAAEALKG